MKKLPPHLLAVAVRLANLRERVVFVGGMIQSLLISDPGAGGTRPTDDVDLIVDLDSLTAFHAMGEDLRALGFKEDTSEGAPICRWVVDGIMADIMPTDPSILGFSNVWYDSAIEHPAIASEGEVRIQLLDGPHFCATKLEAFASRGGDDFYHHDLEDVLKLVDGRSELLGELQRAPDELRAFVADVIAGLLGTARFMEALPGHLDGDEASQARLPLLTARLEQIARLRPPTRSKEVPTFVPLPRESTEDSNTPRQAGSGPSRPAGPVLLRSSNLRSAEYDPSTETLTIAFRSGSAYAYFKVPPTIYDGLLAAYSHGRYHHRWIKNRYRYRRIR